MSIDWTVDYDDEYLQVSFDGKPGYIVIKADDDDFIVEVFPNVGNDPVASCRAGYHELEFDEGK